MVYRADYIWRNATRSIAERLEFEAYDKVTYYSKYSHMMLTRSATAGTMRYCASSWSGDNVTSWEGMRGANAISLNAGVSLLQCFGEDIAGFEGPQPTPELLLRWIQLGIHSTWNF